MLVTDLQYLIVLLHHVLLRRQWLLCNDNVVLYCELRGANTFLSCHCLMHCLALKQRLEQSIDDNICMHLDIRQIVANMFLHHNHIRIKRVALSVGIDICADSMGLLDGICVIPHEPAVGRTARAITVPSCEHPHSLASAHLHTYTR